MTKTFFNYLFSLSVLLLVGSNTLYGYVLNTQIGAGERSVDLNTIGFSVSDDLKANIDSAPFLPAKHQHIIGEEIGEEEEERITSGENFLSTTFSATRSSFCSAVLLKEQLSFYPHFSFEPSCKRYIRFEVFRL